MRTARTYIFSIAALLITLSLVVPFAGRTLGSRNTGAAKPWAKLRKPKIASPVAQRGDADAEESENENAENRSAQFDQLFVHDDSEPSAMSIADASQDKQDEGMVTTGLRFTLPAEYNGDVRNLRPVPSILQDEVELKEPRSMKHPPSEGAAADRPNNTPLAAMPSPIQNFAGLSASDICSGGPCGTGTPPDINGDVGPSHYIEAVNTAYGIYNKTGTLLSSFSENSLFAAGPTGTLCDTNSLGDPVVVYDQFADRWILSNFAFVLSAGHQVSPTFQCFAVSKTNNPVAGGWWLYAVRIDTNAAGQPPTGTLGDYEKFGNWNDGCLYMGANGFNTSGTYVGFIVATFSKAAMESGAALTAGNSSLGFTASGSVFGMFPGNITGAKGAANVPPAGTSNYFVNESFSLFEFEVRKFTPGAGCGTGGVLGAKVGVSQAGYNVFFPGAQVPQPNVANTIDWIDDRMMQKVQYRRVGAAESLWVVHNVVVNAGETVRPQWAQINVNGGTISTTPVQGQIYAPDITLYRWMGSIAADHVGNAALGYSTSNGTSPNFPSIAYSGRLVTDPLNNLPQTEVQLQAGAGSQNHMCGGAPCQRWGDYTAMSVDPTDDCTFWYTNEYYDSQANGTAGNWHTRIGSFKFPTCVAPSAAPTAISGRVTDPNGNAVGGATIGLSGGASRTTITDTNGNYHFDNLETGSFYSVSPSLANYHFSPTSRSFSLIANQTDAAFTASADAVPIANAIDSAEYFVRQQYLDFLGREPDQGGLDFWSSQINACNGDAACIHQKRIDISAAFFMSGEFQETGSYVYDMYAGLLGRTAAFGEFTPDRANVVGGAGLDAAKTAFAGEFVQRSEFTAMYPQILSREQFVDAVLQTMQQRSGVDASALRNGLLTDYDNGGRSLVARHAAESTMFVSAEYNKAFVLIEYFGYLRRGEDPGGYDFWLNVLNQGSGNNYRGMVCSFLTSTEYQRRFSSVVTHSNAECGP